MKRFIYLLREECFFSDKEEFDLDLEWPNELVGVIDLEKKRAIYTSQFGGMYWEHISDKYNHKYTGFQVQGVKVKQDDEGEYIESCSDDEADHWSLYGILEEGGVECIGDFKSREIAEECCKKIYNFAFDCRNK